MLRFDGGVVGATMHWTYTTAPPDGDLQQGDIIALDPSLRAVLSEAHRHFLDPKYTAFTILSQSCDLARRDGRPCRSKYINLAVIRPLDHVLISLLDAICQPLEFGTVSLSGMYEQERESRARELLARILNQNEHSLGLFYFHPDADAGVAEASVALLQVAIALRRDHYGVLTSTRSGRLTPEFQSRLGWITGNLYSRVATQSWRSDQENEQVSRILASSIERGCGPFWIPRKAVTAAKRQGFVPTEPVSPPSLAEQLRSFRPRPSLDMALERIANLAPGVIPDLTEPQLTTLRTRLANDPLFCSALNK